MSRVSQRLGRRGLAIAAVVAAAALAACESSDVTRPSPSDPVAGLQHFVASDSAAKPVDTTAHSPVDTTAHTPSDTTAHTSTDTVPTGPGYFQGKVVGYIAGAGTDTLSSATTVPLANVAITAYRQGTDGRATGSPLATTTTDASGHWQLATLPGGVYVVTVVPASGTPYAGAWTVAYASPQSGDSSWWTMLPHL